MDLEKQFLAETIHDDPRTSSPTRRHRSRSPTKSPIQSPVNTDDELGSDLEDPGADNGAEQVMEPTLSRSAGGSRGGAQTGVKGVLRDAKDRKALNREMNRMRVEQTNASLEARSFQALTVHEEGDARKQDELAKNGDDDGEIKRWRRERQAELMASSRSGGRDSAENEHGYRAVDRLGLREIGAAGFVAAVERPGWVIVMLYEPDISRCHSLLQALLRIQALLLTARYAGSSNQRKGNFLSSQSSFTSAPLLLKGRATALSFSLLPNPGRSGESSRPAEDADNEEEEDDDDESNRPVRKSDPDVLPTVLAYKDGELVHTWIRVDWDVGEDGAGLESLFKKHGIMSKLSQAGTSGDDLDDEYA